MKALKLSSLVILMLFSLRSNAQYDSLFSVISGDTVTLWQTGAWRNCASGYRMEIEQNGSDLTWYQVDTTADPANCNCFFDLSVSFIVTIPGTYHADVYYTPGLEPGNYIYEGFIEFTIGKSHGPVRSEILSQYQSDCYHNIGINKENISETNLHLYPNPLEDGDLLTIEAFSTGKTVLEIYTMTGQEIFSKQYNGINLIRDSFRKDELFPVPGIYVVRFKTEDLFLLRKIVVL